MTLSAVANPALAKNHISHQKTGTNTEQTEQSRFNSSSGKSLSKNKFDDNVTLSQSDKTNDSSKVIDGKAAELLLPRTMKLILANSQTALSVQANTTPQVAQELLARS